MNIFKGAPPINTHNVAAIPVTELSIPSPRQHPLPEGQCIKPTHSNTFYRRE